MEEYDDPIEIALTTDREVAMFLYATGVASAELQSYGMDRGAQTLANLQIRLCSADPDRVASAANQYADGGIIPGSGEMSNEAGVAELADHEEKDPDSLGDGGL